MTHRLCTVLAAAFLASACAAAQTSPAPPERGQLAFKGYELYSWRGTAGEWRYALVPGTNRIKSWEEVAAAGRREGRLKAALKRLPAGESVSWCNGHLDAPPVPLELPPAATVQEIVDLARRHEVRLDVCPPPPAGGREPA